MLRSVKYEILHPILKEKIEGHWEQAKGGQHGFKTVKTGSAWRPHNNPTVLLKIEEHRPY